MLAKKRRPLKKFVVQISKQASFTNKYLNRRKFIGKRNQFNKNEALKGKYLFLRRSKIKLPRKLELNRERFGKRMNYNLLGLINYLLSTSSPLISILYFFFLKKVVVRSFRPYIFKYLKNKMFYKKRFFKKYLLKSNITQQSLSQKILNNLSTSPTNSLYRILNKFSILNKLRSKYWYIFREKRIFKAPKFSKQFKHTKKLNLRANKNVLFIYRKKRFLQFLSFFFRYFETVSRKLLKQTSSSYKSLIRRKIYFLFKRIKKKQRKFLRKKKSFFRKTIYKKKSKFFRYIKNRKILKIYKRKSLYFLIVRSVFNNTFLTIITKAGHTLFKSSAGMNGYVGPKRTTYMASFDNSKILANKFSEYVPKFKKQWYALQGKSLKRRKKNLTIVLKSSIRISSVIAAVKGFNPLEFKFRINRIISKLCRPFNGCKPRKSRRV